MVSKNLVSIGSGYGLVPDGTKPLPEPKLTNHQSDPQKHTWKKFSRILDMTYNWKCYSYYSTQFINASTRSCTIHCVTLIKCRPRIHCILKVEFWGHCPPTPMLHNHETVFIFHHSDSSCTNKYDYQTSGSNPGSWSIMHMCTNMITGFLLGWLISPILLNLITHSLISHIVLHVFHWTVWYKTKFGSQNFGNQIWWHLA